MYLLSGVDPMRVMAVRGLASLEPPKPTKAAIAKHRTAALTLLAAAGVDTTNVLAKPTVSFAETVHHVLVVWYDVAAGVLRLFAPPPLDDTSMKALELLNGSIVLDLAHTPIEDVDATARVMALMSVGGDDAEDLYARFIEPHCRRYDADFPPPCIADFEELWGGMFRYYVGGSNAQPTACDVWIDRVYAFGVGWVPPVQKAKAKAKAKPKAKATAKAKPKAKAKPNPKAKPKRRATT